MGWEGVRALTSRGYLGVEVFFVLSGFVLPLALDHASFRLRAAGTFLGARWVRLYPAYAVAVLVALGLWVVSSWRPGFGGEAPQVTWRSGLGHAFLLCDVLEEPWVVPVFWTLAIEAQFYGLLAVSFPGFVARRLGVRLATAGLWCGAPWLVGIGPTVLSWTGLFLLGATGFLWRSGRLTTAVAALIGLAALVTQVGIHGYMSAAAGALALAVVLGPAGGKPSVLARIGVLSYSLYLVHVPVGGRIINAAGHLTDHSVARLVAIVVALAASLAAAALLHRWVEAPCHRWARRRWRRVTGA